MRLLLPRGASGAGRVGDILGEREGPPGLLTGDGESALMGDPGGLLSPPLPDGIGELRGNGSILGTAGAEGPPFTLTSLLLRNGL